MKNIIECGGLPHVVFMLHSNHVVMLNEAIVALTIMASTFIEGYTDEQLQQYDGAVAANGDKVGGSEGESGTLSPFTISSQLHTDAVINAVKNCLKSPDHPKEVKANAATLILTLLKVRCAEFKQNLCEMNIVSECLNEEALKALPSECTQLLWKLTE